MSASSNFFFNFFFYFWMDLADGTDDFSYEEFIKNIQKNNLENSSDDVEVIDDNRREKEHQPTEIVPDEHGGTRRYWMVNDPKICRFCRKEGHIFRDCDQTVIPCYLWFSIVNPSQSNHNPLECPLRDVCFICYFRGHIRSECPNASTTKRFCKFCDASSHSTMV